MRTYHVYILANQPRGTIYIGVTGDLRRRIMQHKSGSIDGFTKKYNLKHLVFFEEYADMQDALACEKRLNFL